LQRFEHRSFITSTKVKIYYSCNFLNRSLQEFNEEDKDQIAARVKYDHYEKRRKIKMKFIHDFMQSNKKKSR